MHNHFGRRVMKTCKGIAYGTIAFSVYADVEESLTKNEIRDKLLEIAQMVGKDRWILEELNIEDVWDVIDERVQ